MLLNHIRLLSSSTSCRVNFGSKKMSEGEDDIPQLSAETFMALQDFYKEQEERENYFSLSHENTVSEDWQLSQFWYDEETTECLSKVALEAVGSSAKIALVSCPTLFNKIKENLNDEGEVTLYEYDRRFAMYGCDYVPYDYKLPLGLPRGRSNYYDLVIADPPFLSEECLTKTAVTIKFLTSKKIMLCTGAIMEELAQRLLNLRRSSLRPRHKNNLANEFCCYTNFDVEYT